MLRKTLAHRIHSFAANSDSFAPMPLGPCFHYIMSSIPPWS
jgi:hypothetical protein